MRSNKISLDLTNDNKMAIEELAKTYNMKYGPLINYLISTFYNLPEDMRKAYIDF